MSSDTVVFTYKKGGKTITKTLEGSKKIPSREALGLWNVDGKAWKVYGTANKYQALSQDYRRADVMAGLPMGDPSFQQGSVTQGTHQAKQGFVLITQWMDGDNFQKTEGSFNAALKRQNIPHDRNATDYKSIVRGCDAANKVGLSDCQGFIKAKIREPLRFIDVHTFWIPSKEQFGHSAQAAALVEAIDKWAN